MILVVTATELEMRPLREALPDQASVAFLVAGIGPVETSVRLTRYLAGAQHISAVVNVGIAGAYLDRGIDLLDICLAEQEVLGDLGISLANEILALDQDRLPVRTSFKMDGPLLSVAEGILAEEGIACHRGVFVTVNACSGTTVRGNYLRDTFSASCENMEGAAVARVCEEYTLPCLEVRCISNLVEDRNTKRWRLKEACRTGGSAAVRLITGLVVLQKNSGAEGR